MREEPAMEGVTLELARLVVEAQLNDIPEEAQHRAKRHIIDCLGVAVAATASEPGAIITELIAELGEGGSSTVFGSGNKASVVNAAWANGTFAHLLDFDDTGFSHPSACIVPAALTMAQHARASGADLLTGIVLGYEVFERIARVGRSHEPALRARGFHPTALYGCAAAAAAAGRILGLSAEQMAIAIGLALTNAAGLNEQHGSWGKGVHAGNAARSGILAVLLANRGYWASSTILEARYGFYHAVFGDAPLDLSILTENFGFRWAIVEPGLNIKPWPACGRALRAIDAALTLRKKLGITANDIAKVVIQSFPDYVHTLPHVAPTIGFHGKFSLDYCVATSLLDGDVTLDSFTNEAATRPELRSLLEKIEVNVRHDWGSERSRENPVTVHLRDGSQYTETINAPRGSVGNPLTRNELVDKFTGCTSLAGFSEERTSSCLKILWDLEDQASIDPLFSALTS